VVVAHQIADLQVFKINRVVLLQQRQRRLVLEVASLALHRLVVALEQRDRLAPASAALFAATHAPLGFGELSFRCAGLPGLERVEQTAGALATHVSELMSDLVPI
jgi:hypothetical protein